MHRALIAIAIASVLQGAHAAPSLVEPALPEAGILHASLGPAQQDGQVAGRKEATQVAALQPAPAVAQAGEADQEPATAMLVAALLLMVGIALRRWGATRP